jgi:DNA-binding GntR family transcriptional regulator
MTSRVSTTDRVFASLRESILAGEFAAGSLHSIYRLADLMDVSRTPVRDAVLRLADAGLVTIERNRGVRIRGVTVSDVRWVFELRVLIEVPATAYAAEQADPESVAVIEAALDAMRLASAEGETALFTQHDRALHAAIGSVIGNPRLVQEIATLRDSIQTRGASTMDHSRDMAAILAEHVPIVEAIAARDRGAAADRMRDHLVNTANLLMRQVATTGDPPPGEGWADRLIAQLDLGAAPTPRTE